MHTGHWHYIGNDEIMLEAIKLHASNQILHPLSKELTITHIDYSDEKWVEIFFKHSQASIPDIIFFDIQPLENNSPLIKEFLLLVNVIRRNSEFHKTFIMCIYADTDQAQALNHIYTEGINYGLIKKVEQEQAFIDAMYCRYEDMSLRYPIYALAHKMQIPHNFFDLCNVMYFKDGIINLDCDIEYTIGSIENLKLNLFEDFNCSEYEVIDTRDIGNYQLYERSVDFQINYPSPWEDVPEDSMDERTFLTWLENNKENGSLLTSSMTALVISEERELLNQIYEASKLIPCLHYYTNSFKDASQLIVQHRPDLISFCSPSSPSKMEKKEDEEQAELSLEHAEFRTQIQHIINEIRRVEGYTPYLIFFCDEEDVELLKEYFNYHNFLPIQHVFEAQFYIKLIEKVADKLATRRDQLIYHPMPGDSRKVVEIPRNVIITGLTEHEITFLTEDELPYFSQLKLYFPYPVQLMIVPPTRELPYIPKYKHQMAIFHGMSEEDLSLMRRFVNYIIYQPIEKFYFDPHKMVVPEDEGIEVAPSKGLEVAGITSANRKTIKYHTVERGKNKSRSKI